MAIFIGCAGWNLRKEHAENFPALGTHLERYAGRLNSVEINSSFYRSHRTSTYQRWAASTPPGFRFAVKLPKEISHVARLVSVEPQVHQFLAETSGLGDKLGPILVQLPPSVMSSPGLIPRERVPLIVTCLPTVSDALRPVYD